MKKLFLCSLCIVLVLGCSGSSRILDIGYGDYSKENFLLRIGANSTVRKSETVLEVKSISEATLKVSEAVTIYEKEDKDLATVYLVHDSFKSIDYIKANIRDRNGRIISSYDEDDAADISLSGGGTFFSDSRIKILELLYNSFPYTIEYEYQVEYSGLLNFPRWMPQKTGQSVEHSKFTIIDKGQTGVRYKVLNSEMEPTVSDQTGFKTISWEMENSLPMFIEDHGPSALDILPSVVVAPGKFSIGGSSGDASTWKEFGKWYYDLALETRELPDEAKREIDNLIEGVDSQNEKVRLIYDFMQERSRYVSIALGIGGWKPYSATYVFENSYGDCKALTNFMQAALEYIGVNAEAVLIRRGDFTPDMLEDFPSNQFNHVILRVTLDNDEVIWLECTSKYVPANHIGSDNAGKYALLITNEGGELIQVPEQNYTTNIQDNFRFISVSESGDASINSKTKSRGELQDNLLYSLLPVSEKQRVEWLEENLEVDNREITDYDLSGVRKDTTVAEFSFTAEIIGYGNTSSKRLYIPVNKVNSWSITIKSDEERNQPVRFAYPFSEIDSVIFSTPQNFTFESIPRSVSYSFDFGEYSSEIEVLDGNRVLYKRYMAMKEKKVEAERYDELQNFFEKVRTADAQQIVMVASESQ